MRVIAVVVVLLVAAALLAQVVPADAGLFKSPPPEDAFISPLPIIDGGRGLPLARERPLIANGF